MACHGLGPEPPHQQPDSPKDPVLEEDLEADWQPEREHPGQRRPLHDPRPERDQPGSEVPPTDSHGPGEHGPPADGGGPGSPGNAHRRESKVPEDENPVDPRVDQIGQEDDQQQGANCPDRLKRFPDYHESVERKDAWEESEHVLAGERHDLSGLPGPPHHRLDRRVAEHGRYGQAEGQQEASLEAAGNPLVIAGPVGLGNDRVEDRDAAHPERRYREKPDVGHRGSGQGRRGVATDHHGVDDPHGHQAHLEGGEGHGQVDHGTEVRPEGAQHRTGP